MRIELLNINKEYCPKNNNNVYIVYGTIIFKT